MNKDRYLIGDVANLMGMSRDTPATMKNAVWSQPKSRKRLPLLYRSRHFQTYRYPLPEKMDIGLDDIAALWDEHGSEDSPERFHSIISQRLEEEEEAILQHKRTIAKLRMSQKDCENLRNYTGKVIQCPLPDSYIIDPDLDFHDGLEQWFQYTRKARGLEYVPVRRIPDLPGHRKTRLLPELPEIPAASAL